jgi:hypothetical protein
MTFVRMRESLNNTTRRKAITLILRTTVRLNIHVKNYDVTAGSVGLSLLECLYLKLSLTCEDNIKLDLGR